MLKNLWDLTKLIEYLPLFFHKSLKICQPTLLIYIFFILYNISRSVKTHLKTSLRLDKLFLIF